MEKSSFGDYDRLSSTKNDFVFSDSELAEYSTAAMFSKNKSVVGFTRTIDSRRQNEYDFSSHCRV